MRIFYIMMSVLTLSCTSAPKEESMQQSNEPSAREGWEQMKEGASETAEGAGEVAGSAVEGVKEAGRDTASGARSAGGAVAESTRKAGREIKASICPVVGDRVTKVYYTKANKQYDAMLRGEKILSADNRECFMSEENAREGGYRSAAR